MIELVQHPIVTLGGQHRDRARGQREPSALAGRQAQDNYLLFCDLLQDWIMMQAHSCALSGSAGLASASGWSSLGADIGQSITKANALNLDRRSVLLDAFRRIEQVRTTQIAT